MRPLLCIVEGHGEIQAVPALIRRLQPTTARIETWRVHADPIFNGDWAAVEKAAHYGRSISPNCRILLLLDTDCKPERCPKAVAPVLLAEAQRHSAGLTVGLVLAQCEFEAWFLAGAASLRGLRGLPLTLAPPPNPEAVPAAKGWLGRQMAGGTYRETLDQPALAAALDTALARQLSPSFDKFCRVLSELLV